MNIHGVDVIAVRGLENFCWLKYRPPIDSVIVRLKDPVSGSAEQNVGIIVWINRNAHRVLALDESGFVFDFIWRVKIPG